MEKKAKKKLMIARETLVRLSEVSLAKVIAGNMAPHTEQRTCTLEAC